MEFIPYKSEFLQYAEEIFDSNVPDFVGAEEKENLQFFLEKETSELSYFIVFNENEAVGMCGYCFEKEKDEAVLCWGLLHRKHHLKKIGTKMLQFRIAEIKKISATAKIICRTSQVTEGFFAKFGFKTFEAKENYWGEGLHLRSMILEE
ncbi:MAG: GNAT family N-acetyltransferase [Bacteroidia bacterium]|nr:GNAT family N-acetyltransferase [Bacteroidia bacterium]